MSSLFAGVVSLFDAISTHATVDCPYGPFCKLCSTRGHVDRTCPNVPLCEGLYVVATPSLISLACGKRGHKTKKCPVICLLCKARSHLRASCPEREAARPKADRSCWNCGEHGHRRQECTKKHVPRRAEGRGQAFHLSDEAFPALSLALSK